MIDIIDRSTHELQYGASQMAELPRRWRCRGGDPFRQAQSMKGIKVTSPEAFLHIRTATSLEEVQSILMSLPPNVVVAGLDGEPVLRYEASDGVVSAAAAEAQAKRLLRQAHVLGARLAIDDETLSITFRNPDTDNERYGYLKWHLSRVTARTVSYTRPGSKRRTSSPLALLRSMLPDGCRIAGIDTDASRETIVADIAGLTPGQVAEIQSDFQDEFGMRLDLRGQMSLF